MTHDEIIHRTGRLISREDSSEADRMIITGGLYGHCSTV